ncbi:hypothetical protein HJG60_009956 [Phyllostomus discolor]|uniref:Uncharacterized protein n=1 Tax=Phyllostomus discolor TaxID=89673 RepID=A0A834EQJ0_9CHIR|nr:hypothetical protein HJG60_009956 [Phyllostomus discolor]
MVSSFDVIQCSVSKNRNPLPVAEVQVRGELEPAAQTREGRRTSPSPPPPHSVTPWWLETGRCGRSHTFNMGKCCEAGLWCFLRAGLAEHRSQRGSLWIMREHLAGALLQLETRSGRVIRNKANNVFQGFPPPLRDHVTYLSLGLHIPSPFLGLTVTSSTVRFGSSHAGCRPAFSRTVAGGCLYVPFSGQK